MLLLFLATGALAAPGVGTTPMAHVYISGSAIAVNCAVQGTYYEIPAWTVGTEWNVDGQTDGDIVATYAGTYLLKAFVKVDAVNAHEYEFCGFVDGQEIKSMEGGFLGETGTHHSISSTACITSCAAGAVFDLRIADETGTGSINVQHAQFSAVRIGP